MTNRDVSVVKHQLQFPGCCYRFHIVPFGDVHYDSDACSRVEFRRFLKAAAELENPYYLGVGDYLDFASQSERKVLRRDGDLHDSTSEKLDRVAQADIKEFATAIQQMKGRTIGLLTGNHDWHFPNGETGTDRLARELGCPAWGWLTCVIISARGNRGHCTGHKLVACHGKAGGKLAGTTINQVDQLRDIFPACDFYIMGHDHRRGGVPMSALTFDAISGVPRLRDQEQWLVRSGSFLRSYQAGQASYAARRLLRPASMGGVAIEVVVSRYGEAKGASQTVQRSRVLPL